MDRSPRSPRFVRTAVLCAVLLGACQGSGDGVPTCGAADGQCPQGCEYAVDSDCPMLSSAMAQTTSGVVQGVAGDGVTIFRGIPYAAPPTGERRWRPPAPPTPWTGVLDATQFGKACLQVDSPFLSDSALPPPEEQSEDCLTLNVWTPARASGAGLPVMVWIHGGGWNLGAGSQPMFEGTHLAGQGDVVLVTFNYRLGPFGFLAHPSLTAESTDGSSGNYGLRDQIAALEWVRDNAESFGGDPANVTVFGESAGGGSICLLLVAPAADGLFHRAVIESANCPAPWRDRTVDTTRWQSAEHLGVWCGEQLGCSAAADPLACLRAASFPDLVASCKVSSGSFDPSGEKYLPIVDGVVVPVQPAQALAAGTLTSVPLLAGTTADEAALFASTFPNTLAGYEATIHAMFGATNGDLVLGAYPAATDAEARPAYTRFITDFTFVCPTRRTLREAAAAGLPTWRFHFTRVHPSGAALGLGSCHGSELYYLFGNLDPYGNYPDQLTADDVALSDAMIAAWSSFARSGDPSVPGWTAFSVATDAYLTLDWPLAAGTDLRKAECDLYETIVP